MLSKHLAKIISYTKLKVPDFTFITSKLIPNQMGIFFIPGYYYAGTVVLLIVLNILVVTQL